MKLAQALNWAKQRLSVQAQRQTAQNAAQNQAQRPPVQGQAVIPLAMQGHPPSQQLAALTPANLKKQEEVAAAQRQQSLQAQRKGDNSHQPGMAPVHIPPPAGSLTGSPDGAAVWAPKLGLKQEDLVWPPPKRQKRTPNTSPQQGNHSQSPPIAAASLSATPFGNARGVPVATEVQRPVEVFKCTYNKCEFANRGFLSKEHLAKHLEEHKAREKAMEKQISNPLEYCLISVRNGLGLNREKKEKEETEATSSENREKESEHMQSRVSTTPLLAGTTPAKFGVTPGKSASPAGGMKTPAPSSKTLPASTGSVKKEDTPTGGMDKVPLRSDPNDQLPTPPNSTLWEGALSPNTIRQCFSGLEQFSGLTAPRGRDYMAMDFSLDLDDKLTPAYTPGASPDTGDAASSGAGSDGDSVVAGLVEEWAPFGEKSGFLTAGFEEIDLEIEMETQRRRGLEVEIVSGWDTSLFELRC